MLYILFCFGRLYEGPEEDAVEVQNPVNEDFFYEKNSCAESFKSCRGK